MRKILSGLLLVILFSQYTFAQTKLPEAAKHGNLDAYLIELMQITGKDNIEHIDSLHNYKVNIPLWWKIKETPTTDLFGGIFPAIDGVENALLFKSYSKAKFKNVADFEDWIIKSYKMGDVPKWSDGSHKLLLKKEIADFSVIGKSYSLQLMRGKSIYKCCYIIIETRDTFLWVDFTATTDTYNANFKKLKEIMAGFSVI